MVAALLCLMVVLGFMTGLLLQKQPEVTLFIGPVVQWCHADYTTTTVSFSYQTKPAVHRLINSDAYTMASPADQETAVRAYPITAIFSGTTARVSATNHRFINDDIIIGNWTDPYTPSNFWECEYWARLWFSLNSPFPFP